MILFLIDCREDNEYAVASIAGAELMPMSRWQDEIPKLDNWQGKHLVVHCHHGRRFSKSWRGCARMGSQPHKACRVVSMLGVSRSIRSTEILGLLTASFKCGDRLCSDSMRGTRWSATLPLTKRFPSTKKIAKVFPEHDLFQCVPSDEFAILFG